jgi:5-methylcytosine-specific restriction enzyme A
MAGRLYDRNFWRKVRRQYRRMHPLCERCLSLGKVIAATAVHHKERHGNDYTKFRLSPLMALCSSCHDSWMQQKERNGYARDIGPDGYPIDPDHPFWRAEPRKS